MLAKKKSLIGIVLLMALLSGILFAQVDQIGTKQTDKEKMQIQKDIDDMNKQMERLKQENEKIKTFAQQATAYLKSQGINPGNDSFRMKRKNIWQLNFHNQVYLNKRKLNLNVSEEIFNISNRVFQTKGLIELSFPEGLEKAMKDAMIEPVVPRN